MGFGGSCNLVYGMVDCGGEMVWCGGELQWWYHSELLFSLLFFFFFPDFWYGYYVMMVVDAGCDFFCGCGSGDLFLAGGWWRYYMEVASFDHEGDVW